MSRVQSDLSSTPPSALGSIPGTPDRGVLVGAGAPSFPRKFWRTDHSRVLFRNKSDDMELAPMSSDDRVQDSHSLGWSPWLRSMPVPFLPISQSFSRNAATTGHSPSSWKMTKGF